MKIKTFYFLNGRSTTMPAKESGGDLPTAQEEINAWLNEYMQKESMSRSYPTILHIEQSSSGRCDHHTTLTLIYE